MVSSEELWSMIRKFEGLRLSAYKCSSGVWTIGYGHTAGVKRGDRITKGAAERLLCEDIAAAERDASRIGLYLDTQGKWDAIVDFVFNLGWKKFSRSTLYRYITSRRSDADITAQLKRWVYSDGKVSRGLVKRRAWEATRWTEKD